MSEHTPEENSPGAGSTSDDARVAGRGFLLITAAKVWFMVGGALITFGLPYIFDAVSGKGKALYGQYLDVNNILSIFSMVMVTGVMQTVSKFVSEKPDRAVGIVQQTQNLMLVVAGLIGALFLIGAPWIAEWRGNPELVNAYRLAGMILFSYGIYTVYIGVLNGQKRFFSQACFDMGFATMRVVLMLGAAALGFGVVGAFAGWSTAAIIITIVALVYVRKTSGLERSAELNGTDSSSQKEERLYPFALNVMLYAFVFNLTFKIDIVCLKPIAAALQFNADNFIAEYGMAVQFSRLPWQATLAITFIVFPMVSGAVFAQDLERARGYIRQTMRYSMILVGGASVVLMSIPDAIFGILPEKYSPGAIALSWLAPAYFAFSLFNIANTILMSAGRAGQALLIGTMTVVINLSLFGALYLAAEPMGLSHHQLLKWASICTFVAFSTGLALGLFCLMRFYGAIVPIKTGVRVFGISIVLAVLGRLLPQISPVMTICMAVIIGFGYLVGLFMTQEFDADDKERLMKVIRRKKT